VTYPDSTVLCGNNANPVVIRNAVTLGVACQTENATFIYNGHLLFECGEASDDFEYIIDNSVVKGARYSCGSLATFANSSVPTEQLITNFSIITDDLWLTKDFTDCFTVGSGMAAPSVPTTNMTPTTPVPIQTPTNNTVPITLSPSQAPQTSDFSQAINPTLNSSDAVPATTADSKSDTGIWIGLFVGGVTTGILLVAGIVLLQRRKPRAANPPVEESMVHSSLSETSCPGPLPPLVEPQKEVSPRNPRTVHNVGSEVAVIENASLAVVLEVSDIPGNRAEPSGIYAAWDV
jgi:hypothetical protein